MYGQYRTPHETAYTDSQSSNRIGSIGGVFASPYISNPYSQSLPQQNPYGLPLPPPPSFAVTTPPPTPWAAASPATSFSGWAIYNFSHTIKGCYSVNDLLKINKNNPIFQPLSAHDSFDIHPKDIIAKYSNSVGMLCEVINGAAYRIATATILAKNTIICARHSVNEYALGQLSFFYKNTYYRLKLLEDGSLFDEDYIIFRVITAPQTSIMTNLRISTDLPANGSHILCMGILASQTNGGLCVTMSIYNTFSLGSSITLDLPQFHTDEGFSGAPYIDAKGQLLGIHLKTTNQTLFLGERTGLSLANLRYLNYGNNLIAACITGCLNVSTIPYDNMQDDEIFDEFSTLVAELSQTEEGDKRKYLFGNTPTLNTGTGRAVLKSSETTGLAKYNGTLTGEQKYKDLANWEVKVEKTLGAVKQWINLTTKDPRKPTKAAIQMGHIVSVAEYWNTGKAGHPKYSQPAKNEWLQHQGNKKTFSQATARPFMTDDTNYRFEWCELNESNGKNEPKFAAPTGKAWVKNAKGKPELQ